ncbi:MAG: hypothetical protein JWL63_195, partial [Rhodocyclales bacterium]|nr:hypothetical protein [Rhodocyclales bacterium]
MAEMNNPQLQGTIQRIEGNAWLKLPDGTLVALKPGDHINAGDIIITGHDTHVELARPNGAPVDIGPDRTVVADQDVLGQSAPDKSEAAILPLDTDADRVIAALNAGQDPFAAVEPAEAGLIAGGTDSGHGFVRLLRIVEGVAATNFDGATGAAQTDTLRPALGGGDDLLSDAAVSSTTTPPPPESLVLSAAGAVSEGGSIVYTVTAGTPVSGSPLVITLSSGLTVTIPVGASSGSSAPVAVRADDVYKHADDTITVGISSASGGSLSAYTLGSPISTVVRDDADTTTVALTATPSTAESGVITYTASLTAPVTGSPVSVTLSNGQTITIPVGSSSGSVSSTAPDDVYAGGSSVSATISTVSGGNFENLVASSTPAITTITDDSDVTTLALSASPSVAEGGNIVYTATLSNAAATPLTVTLSNGATINIAAGTTSGTVSVAAPSDDVYVDAGSVSAFISGTTGGNFENLVANPTPATTSVTDTVDASSITLTASAPSVTEGGSVTYTATVNNAVTGSPLVVTLSNGQTITIPVGASTANSAPFAVRADDVYAQGTQALAVGISGTAGGNYEALTTTSTVSINVVDDADATTVTLTASAASVTEGGTVTYTATVNNAVTGSPLVVTLSNGQTITIPVGASTANSVPFAVRADDVYAQGTQALAVGISGTAGGNYETLTTTSTVSTNVVDDADATTVTLTASAASVTEGGTVTYTATVNNAVTGSPLVVTLSNGQTITIPVGASTANSAPFAVRADEAYVQGTQTLAVGISGTAGGNYETLTTTSTVSTNVVDDSDATTVTLTASAPSVTEGGSITYTASVNNAVTGSPLVVTLSNGQTITIPVGASTANSAPFTVRADDVYVQGTQAIAVGISGTTGGNYEALTTTSTVSTNVVDDADATTVTLTASAASVTEGGSITYTATVGNPVTGSPLVVTLSNGASITIPVGSTSANSAPVPVRADDAYVQGTDVVSVGISATSGGGYEALTTTSTVSTNVVDDADATTVTLSTSAATVTEGGSIVYTATVGNAVTGSPLVVSLSNGQTITIPVGATSANSAAFAVRADDVEVQGSQPLTVGISGTAGGNYEAITTTSTVNTNVVDDSDITTMTLSGAASVVEGGTAGYTVSLTSTTSTAITVTLSYSGTAANGVDFTGVTTVTIPAGASSANFNIATINDALAEGAENFTVALASFSGGNFENLVLASPGAGGSVNTGIVDDDISTLSLSATPTLSEAGGTIVYTATLTQAPVAPMTVTLSNGATISIAAGAFSGSTSVPLAASDDVYIDPTSVSATISSSSGGGIAVSIDPTAATTSITDTIDATSITLSASAASVAEGGSITYTATVSSAVTGSPLVVTLTNGQTITIPVGASTANGVPFAVRADDAYVQGTQTLAVGISGAAGGNYEALTTTSTVSTNVVDDSDATTVTLTASAPSVTEGGSITYTATVSNVVTGSPLVVTLSNGQTITIPVGASTGNSTPFAVRGDDVYVQGTQTLNVGISATSGGNYETLTTTSTVSTNVVDDADATSVTLTASAASVTEGGTVTYTATVNNAVTGAPLVVTLSNGQTITIPVGASTANSTPFAVRADEAYVQGTQTLAVGISGTTGGNYEALTTTSTVNTNVVDDADATVVTLTASAASVTEGGSITYTATVTNAVTGSPLVVTLSNGQTITIPVGTTTANSAPFTVRADDVYVQGTQALAVGISGTTGGNYEALTTTSTVSTNVVDDSDATTVTLTASAPSVTEGGSITYTATVNNAVTGSPLVVTLSNGQTITIPVGASTANSTPFAVRADDVYAQGTQAIAVGISGTAGGSYETLTTTSSVSTNVVDDADATTVTLTASAASVTEGGSVVYTATVNNAVTGAPLVVTLSNGQTITIPVGASTANSAPFAVRADDVYVQGTQALAVGISGTTGGSYEALTTSSTVSTNVVDDSDATTVTLTASAPSVT